MPRRAKKLANPVVPCSLNHDRPDYIRTFLQPFLTYTTPSATSFTLQTESTYDRQSETWSVPVNVSAGRVVKAGSQLLQRKAGVSFLFPR